MAIMLKLSNIERRYRGAYLNILMTMRAELTGNR